MWLSVLCAAPLVPTVHCWAYRAWAAQQAAVSPAAEFAFTTEKILENFSNYSAWHYRSKLLPRLGPITVAALAGELEIIQQVSCPCLC